MSAKKESKRQEDFFDTCRECKVNWSCCHETTPPITNRRKKIIENFLVENEIAIKTPFVEKGYIFPRLDKDGYCVFHDRRTRKCIIHSVKPETCVAGPITFDIDRNTGKVEWYIKMEQICPLAGRVYQDKARMRKHLKSAKKEISSLIGELDSVALDTILKKDEPETFKLSAE
jgi:Fe-S-cluster containining protein